MNKRKIKLFAVIMAAVMLVGFLLLRVFPDVFNNTGDSVDIFYDSGNPAISFAANDIKAVCEARGKTVTLRPLSQLDQSASLRIILSDYSSSIASTLSSEGGASVSSMNTEEFALRVTSQSRKTAYWAIGGDEVGTMYGGFDIAEKDKTRQTFRR